MAEARLSSEPLDDAELGRRCALLAERHWKLLIAMKDERVMVRRGTTLMRTAHELQKQALAWPLRSPWWTITKHGTRALGLYGPKEDANG